jgi:hypothetical protein
MITFLFFRCITDKTLYVRHVIKEELTTMNCFNHENQCAVAICMNCGRGLCHSCCEEFRDGILCKSCVRETIKLSYSDGQTIREVPFFWFPRERIPRVGEYICFAERDNSEEEVARVMCVTYDLRGRAKIVLDVEPLSDAKRRQSPSACHRLRKP